MLETATAQIAPVPIDPSALTVYGPLGLMVALLLWYIARIHDRMDKRDEQYRMELAAERSLNAQLQDKRIEDHKVLIPLSNSMVVSAQQTSEIVRRVMEK